MAEGYLAVKGRVTKMNKLYSVDDLKVYLRVSRSRLYELIAGGLKPSLYLGSSPRWTEEALLVFLAEQPTCRGRKSPVINGGTK
jgi:hypothetical protein